MALRSVANAKRRSRSAAEQLPVEKRRSRDDDHHRDGNDNNEHDRGDDRRAFLRLDGEFTTVVPGADG